MTATDIKRLLNKALNRIRVAGTGTDTDGPVTIHLCVATSSTPPTSCGSGNETMVVTATVSGGTWNTGWNTATETGTWYARATQTDTAGNVGESPVFGPVSD